MVALGVQFAASACSVIGMEGPLSAERLARELAPVAERFAATGDPPPTRVPPTTRPARQGSVLAERAASGRQGQADVSAGGAAAGGRNAAARIAAGGARPVGERSGAAATKLGPRQTRDRPTTAQVPRLTPRPRPGPFSMNLYRTGDFVHQQTTFYCVPASAQTMMNIMDDGRPNRSANYQRRLFRLGHLLDEDDDDEWDDEPWWQKHGMGLDDWTTLLNHKGYGPFDLDRARTRNVAIRKAAKAVRMTGKPAGLVVWRGAHAWVMSGFRATADPAFTDDFKVTAVYIQDVWYPFVSSIWGASRPPNSLVPVSALGADYLRYNRPTRRHPMRDGKFMLVLPQLPEQTTSPEPIVEGPPDAVAEARSSNGAN